MDKELLDGLPDYADVARQWTTRRRKRRLLRLLAAVSVGYFVYSAYQITTNTAKAPTTLSISRLQADYETCTALRRTVADPDGERSYNKRWVNGTRPVLIRNATIWTGEPTPGTSAAAARRGEGFSWSTGDVFLERGLIVQVASSIAPSNLPPDYDIIDADGRQLTAGIVDMHSHAGLGGFANIGDDTNELSADITPYVRSLDGLDPLQPEILWVKSGGVTTSLLLPGSGNNMGGEAFVIKLAAGARDGREELSQGDMLADPDRTWRYMKMACGENPKRVYGRVGEHGPTSRLGEAWEFRHALEQAQKYVQSQDDWCAAAERVGALNMPAYLPQELRWESLGAVLRGHVRVNTHCYTIADLEAFVRHTNEFKFRLRAFHHAHQTYLVPDILKRTWGGTPAAALFADNMYYKVEAYTASEEAGKILYQDGITPVYVSDNPVLNAQHVVFEAAKAYTFGLPYHAALAGVTSAPAELLGLGNRIGKVKPGFDADIVLWDSDPLSVGAAPVQVWIDGSAQFKDPFLLKKPVSPPIKPEPELATTLTKNEHEISDIVFTGISKVLLPGYEGSVAADQTAVVISNGAVSCIGACPEELSRAASRHIRTIKLRNGHFTPPFTAFGSSLGLVEIDAEEDTQDGDNTATWTRAVDGLALDGKQLAAAHTHGVTRAISAPSRGSIDSRGVSVGFSTGAKTALDRGAVWQDEVAVHYTLTLSAKSDKTPSLSSAIGALRQGLLEAVFANDTVPAIEGYSEKAYLQKVVRGDLPLILSVHSADTIAAILRLKNDVESASTTSTTKPTLRIVLLGGAESHLVAAQLAAADVAVVLAPLLTYSQSWDQRRSLTGAPLTNGTAIDALLDAGVRVAIGVNEIWETRELGLMAAWAYRNGGGRLTETQALELVSGNVYEILGLKEKSLDNLDKESNNVVGNDWVIWEGNPLETGGRVKAVGSMGRVSVWA